MVNVPFFFVLRKVFDKKERKTKKYVWTDIRDLYCSKNNRAL